MITPFIYAEEACGFDRIEDLEEARPSQYFTREPTRFSVEPVTRNASIMSIQERLVGGLRKTAAQRYLDFRRLYPGLDARIPQYHVAGYLGVSPEFLSKLRKRLIRDEYRLAPS
jgi:CRP-like cAMP-binding protein